VPTPDPDPVPTPDPAPEESDKAPTGSDSGPQGKKPKGGCFIATAAYGSDMALPVQYLRNFRDEAAAHSRYGGFFKGAFNLYYRTSPPIAALMRRSRWVKNVIKYVVVMPGLAIIKAGVALFKRKH